MSENVETDEIPDTAAEVIDLFNRGDAAAEPEAPSYHTILEAWREVLRPAEVEAGKKVTPQWASKMVQTYPQLTYADCLAVRDRYFAKLQQIRDVIDLEISTHPGCLDYSTPEEDLAENSEIYKAILLTWQQITLQWELEWTCNHLHAPAELASISEAHKTMFGDSTRPGLTAYLDNIKFEYTEDDQVAVAAVLSEQRDAYIDAEVTGE